MNRIDTIRPYLAGLMLLLFALSITPKKPLHDLLANHRDTPAKWSGKIKEVSKSGFHCDTENLVVESSFLAIPIPLLSIPPVIYTSALTSTICAGRLTEPFLYFEKRGPPTV